MQTKGSLRVTSSWKMHFEKICFISRYLKLGMMCKYAVTWYFKQMHIQHCTLQLWLPQHFNELVAPCWWKYHLIKVDIKVDVSSVPTHVVHPMNITITKFSFKIYIKFQLLWKWSLEFIKPSHYFIFAVLFILLFKLKLKLGYWLTNCLVINLIIS